MLHAKLLLPLLTCVLVAVLTTGCPLFKRNPAEFTSADVNNVNPGVRYLDDDLAEAPTDGAEGESPAPRDVVEPDVIRRDGNLLYVLNQFRGLTIVDLDTFTILGQAPTYGFPRDLYIVGERAYVLVGQARDFAVAEDVVTATMASRLFVLDIASPTSPEIVSTFDLDGDLVDSRLVGDVLYAVGADYGYYGTDDGVVEGRPALKQGPASAVTSINVADAENVFQADQLRFDGQGTVIHATSSAVFVAAPSFQGNTTDITVVDISDPAGAMAISGAASVRGYVADRFKLDAWNGALRVVSSSFESERQVYVTTIDLETLDTLAELPLEDAAGDSLFATRFDGPLAYVVTYFQIDPLFVVDLTDPANPALREPLEVPGFSTHIEPRGDRLITLGVDDTNGRLVEVGLYDVSGDPVRLDDVEFGENWSWSNAFSDVKAFTVLDDLIIVPFSGWAESFGGFERLQFISYTRDTLELRGFVDLDGTILRSLEYEDHFYGVTSEQLAQIDASDLDNPQVVETLTLAENVVDFIEISPELGLEVIQRYDDGTTLIRTVDAALNELAEISLNVGGFTDIFMSGGRAAVVGIAWENQPAYEVAFIDVVEQAPVLVNQLTLDVEPYFGYYYYGPYDIEPVFGAAEGGKSILPPGPVSYGSGDRGFVLDGVLALRCFTDDLDLILGDDPVQQALALINIASAQWTSTVGLGYDNVTSIDAVGNKLYVGSKEEEGFDSGQPICAYFIREVDVLNGADGPVANVPGEFVQYDPATDLLTLRDYQWDPIVYTRMSIETVRWDGADSVEALDSFELPVYSGEIVGAGSRVYYTSYAEAFSLEEIVVAANGALTAGSKVTVANTWATFLGARGASAYLTLGGGAIARYDFDDGGALADLVEVMGTPYIIRFGAAQAYAPMGYFGIVTLPL